MIVLDATNRSLEVVLAAAPASAQPEFFASYADLDPAAITLTANSNAGTANGTTAVTMVAAPGTSALRRQIKYVSIWNADTAQVLVTVQVNIGGTLRRLARIALSSGQTLQYTDRGGWEVITAQTVSGGIGIASLAASDWALDDDVPFYDASLAGERKGSVGRHLGLRFAVPGGRLTLTTGTPITNADVNGSTLYYTPFLHNRIELYDGTRWALYAFTEQSVAVPATATRPFDVFGYLSAGALALDPPLVWSSDTARATTLVRQDGRLVKNGDATRLYLGSGRTIAASTCHDTDTNRYLINAYNQVNRRLFLCPGWTDTDSTTSYTHATTATWSEIFSTGGARVQWLDAYDYLGPRPYLNAKFNYNLGAGTTSFGLGIDSVTSAQAAAVDNSGLNFTCSMNVPFRPPFVLGARYAAMLAQVPASTTIFADRVRAGSTADPYATYLEGEVWG